MQICFILKERNAVHSLLSFQDCFSNINSRRPLKLMMTPVRPRPLNMINDSVLMRYRARVHEDMSAIEVQKLLLLLLIIICIMILRSKCCSYCHSEIFGMWSII